MGVAVAAFPAASCTIPGAPIGVVDSLRTNSGGGVTVEGWTFDPDVPTQSIEVEITANGKLVTNLFRAGGDRPDIAAAYPEAGPFHGFSASFTLPRGTFEVCIRGINDPATRGIQGDLGCQQVVITNLLPFGSLDSLTTVPASGQIPGTQIFLTPGSVTATGWSIDPDGSGPVTVELYDGANLVTSTVANLDRADVGAAYPGQGIAHGFTISANLFKGSHLICVFLRDTSGEPVRGTLGCQNLTV